MLEYHSALYWMKHHGSLWLIVKGLWLQFWDKYYFNHPQWIERVIKNSKEMKDDQTPFKVIMIYWQPTAFLLFFSFRYFKIIMMDSTHLLTKLSCEKNDISKQEHPSMYASIHPSIHFSQCYKRTSWFPFPWMPLHLYGVKVTWTIIYPQR